MPIVKREVTNYRVEYMCDNCDTAMIDVSPTIHPSMNLPPQTHYEHNCPKCGMDIILPLSYPYDDWEYVDGRGSNH